MSVRKCRIDCLRGWIAWHSLGARRLAYPDDTSCLLRAGLLALYSAHRINRPFLRGRRWF